MRPTVTLNFDMHVGMAATALAFLVLCLLIRPKLLASINGPQLTGTSNGAFAHTAPESRCLDGFVKADMMATALALVKVIRGWSKLAASIHGRCTINRTATLTALEGRVKQPIIRESVHWVAQVHKLQR